MRNLVLILVLLTVQIAAGQNVSKVIPFKSGQKISMKFDYPQLIKVSTWDKNEVSVLGYVDINDGENNDVFQLEATTGSSTVTIQSSIRNIHELPRRDMVIRDNQKIKFKSKDEYRKYVREAGDDHMIYSDGSDIDIKLEIKVPRGADTRILSVYGMVEVKNFEGPLQVEATYGGVDVALSEKSVSELTAETDFGQIFTNLEAKTIAQNEGNFHTEILMRPRSGVRYSFESKYGNVYLRKE
ncbi:MAG: hypothetical protein ACK514_11595 [Bacteroidota bacterium]|jgi:hypothetical protein|nr:hypothetical protein [Cytophagales bacterium]MCE2957821.1 hypothetical protein [Flammeovirgaceae bacterium]MCZ8071186.1 hypothetical protein [Cytophagales bacterium]